MPTDLFTGQHYSEKNQVEVRQPKDLLAGYTAPTEEESVFDSMGRAVARTGRDMVTGMVQLPELVSRPVGQLMDMAADAVGFEDTSFGGSPSELVKQTIDNATDGYTAPQNELEQNVSNISQIVSSAAPIKAMAGAVPLLEKLAPQTAKDLMAYFTAGAGAEIGKEAELEVGGADVGAIAGGVAGAFVPGAASSAARQAMRPVKTTGNVVKKVVKGRTPEEIIKAHIPSEKMAQIRDELAASGKQSLIADFAGDDMQGLMRLVGRQPGKAKQLVTDALNSRSEAAVARVQHLLKSKVSRVQSYLGNIDDMVAARKKMADPLYKKARAEGTNITDTRLKEFLKDKRVTDAIKVAKKEYGVTDEALPNSIETMDGVKKVLDDISEAAYRKGKNQLGKTYSDLKRGLVEVLDDVNPTYKEARKIFSEYSEVLKAQNAGRKFTNSRPEEIIRQTRHYGADQLDAYRIGVRENLSQTVAKTPDGADPAKRIFGNSEKRNQIKAVFRGDAKGFKEFEKTLKEEIAAAQTKFRVTGQSRTDINQSLDTSAGEVILEAGARDGLMSLINKAGGVALDKLKTRYKGITQANAEKLAKILTSKEDQLRMLDDLIVGSSSSQKEALLKAKKELSIILATTRKTKEKEKWLQLQAEQ